MTRTRMVHGLAVVAAVPLMLTACGGSDDDEAAGGNATSLRILDYYNNEPDRSQVQERLDTCADEIGVALERETVPGADLISTVLQRASSDTLPDVLMLDNPDVKQIAATGALAPLGAYGLDAEGYIPGIVDAVTHDGELYGLPPVVNTLGIFYDAAVLDEAGIEPPTTWDELRTAAEELTEGDRYGIALSAIATYEGAWQLLPAMWTNGGDETDLTSAEVAEALQLWVDLVDSGSASNSVVNWSQADVSDQFSAGRAAMMVNGPWQIPALEEDGEIDWDVVQFPVNDPAQTPVAPLGGEAWTVPVTGDDDRQAAAAEFIGCLNSDENQLQLGIDRYQVPTKVALNEQYVEEVPMMEAFAEQVTTARSRTGQLGEEWPQTATVMYDAIQLALTGQASAADAFQQTAGE